jgi:L-aspartate oxidase
MNSYFETDVLIIGIGLSGATTALKLADNGLQVTIITKSFQEEETNTFYAQGGIIYKSKDDTPVKLAEDIINAGDGLCKPEAVQLLCEKGPQSVEEILLERLKINFDKNAENEHELAAEGGHTYARILHTSDTTGKTIQESVLSALKEHPNVTILNGLTAVDLLTTEHHSTNRLAIYDPIKCVGAFLLDREKSQVIRCISRFIVLATGGCGRLFLRTTNPAGARGDGIAMAYRAGARVINMEYIQFHPTTFFHSNSPAFLISEAVRGAGAKLVNHQGEYFMEKYSPGWKDLAPRDVVARAIHSEMLKNDTSHVFLDFKSFIQPEVIKSHFPNIYEFCKKYGTDLYKDLVPVVPAAHYSCGGLWVNLNGQTTIENLYAVGEVACTGVHGANRLASTSLLENLVFGIETANHINTIKEKTTLINQAEIPDWQSAEDFEPDPALIAQDMTSIRNIMWNYVGLIRNKYRLQRAIQDLRSLEQEIDRFYRKANITDDLLGIRNAVRTALIIAGAAWENKESRGCHYREN